jgi:hypothetical protein
VIKALRFGRLFLFSPSKAAAAASEERALLDGLKVYGLTLLAAAIFQYWKPYDFPDAVAAVPRVSQGFFFWLKVMMWQPLLMAFLIAFTGALLEWMKAGWLPLKVASSFFWTAIPAILMVCYLPREAGPSLLNKLQFQILFGLWLAPTIVAVRKVPASFWRPLAAYLLVMNVVELAAFFPEAAVTIMRWEAGYKGVVGTAGLWMLMGGALGLKHLNPPRPLPRALLPLLFALVLQIEVVMVAFMLGWLPVETLKALLYG